MTLPCGSLALVFHTNDGMEYRPSVSDAADIRPSDALWLQYQKLSEPERTRFVATLLRASI